MSETKAEKDEEEDSKDPSLAEGDGASSSVAELRRKAQEHTAALWQLAQSVQQQQQHGVVADAQVKKEEKAVVKKEMEEVEDQISDSAKND